jgi:hypothetical protein
MTLYRHDKDEIIGVIPSPPGWIALFDPLADGLSDYAEPYTEPVLGFIIYRRHGDRGWFTSISVLTPIAGEVGIGSDLAGYIGPSGEVWALGRDFKTVEQYRKYFKQMQQGYQESMRNPTKS